MRTPLDTAGPHISTPAPVALEALDRPGGPLAPRGGRALLAPGVAAVVVLVAALVAAGSAPAASPAGLADAGAVVRWGVPVARLLVDLSAVVTVGGLLVAAVLVPTTRPAQRISGPADRARRSAAGWSALWAASALAAAMLTAWEVAGFPPDRLPVGDLPALVWTLPAGRALTMTAALAALVPVLALRSRGRGGTAAALVVALAALTPPVYAGHAAHVVGHDVATGALVVHVAAASVWLGGLVGLAIHLRGHDPLLPAAATRFSGVALGAFGALVLSGGLVAAASLGMTSARWTSPYAALVLVKVCCAVALGLVGAAHRRWTLVRLRAGAPRAFACLVAAELVLMGGTVGLAVALSRTPGASGSGLLERPQRAVGPGGVAEHVSLGDLLADWRPEPVLTTVAVIGLVTYLRWQRTWVDGTPVPGARPPVGAARRVAATSSAAGLLVLTAGLPTAYDGHPLVGVQGGQLVVLLLVVPALLVAGGVGAGLRPPGAGSGSATPSGAVGQPPWWRLVSDPATGFVAVLVATVTVLASPVRVLASTGPGRVLTLALVAGAGVLFTVSVWGLAHAAGRPHLAARRAPVLGLTALFLGTFGALLAAGAAGAGAWTAADLSDPAGLGPAGDPRAAGWVLCGSAVALGIAGGLRLRAQHRSDRRRGDAAAVVRAGEPPGRELGAGDVLAKG